MADNLATISVDRINKAVNNAVRLSRLNQLSEMHGKSSTTVPKSTVQGKSFIASTSKGPTQSTTAKNDHVFIKPSSGVPKKRSDGASGVRSSSVSRSPAQLSASLPNTASPTLTTGPNVNTVTQAGLSTPVLRPSISAPSGPATLSPPTILSGPIVHTVAPIGLSSPIIRPSIGALSTLSSPTITTQEGVTLQVQMPVVQSLPPGSQIINPYVPQGGSPVLTLDGKALRLVPIPPGKSPGVAALPQTVTAVQPLTTRVTSQEIQIVSARPLSSPGASPVTQTVTMVSSAGPMQPQVSVTPSCSIDAPDLLAAATQAAVPHLVTRYPSQQPVRTVLVQGIENSNASHKTSKAVAGTNDHVQSPVSSGGTSIAMTTTEPPSPTVEQSQQADSNTGSKKRKTVYAILVNQDCTTTPSKGQLEHLMTEFEAYHPADEAKPTDASLTFSGYFCPECNRVNPEECGMHTVNTETISDSLVISRARATLPACLRINPQGVGSVEAAVKIKKFTKFGPLIGVKKEGTVMAQTPYLWKVFTSQTEWLDCSDEEQSNWMRFVRQATLSVEQNVIAYLIEENIYFMTLEDIKPNTELRYWYSEDYAKHIGKSLHPGGGFTCLPCLKLFDSLHALNQHCRYSHADTSKRKFKCNVCERTFSSSSKCKTHMLSHTGQKPHRCQYCPKSFSDQSNLRMHLLIHSDVRKFECTVCKRMFKQKAHLTSHMLTHTGEKNMECEYCGKLFARRSDLRQHKLQHTKEQIHECDHPGCKKIFYKLQNLKKHYKIHFGVRDFACQKCQKTFTSAYHLKRHVNNRRDCCPKTVEEAPT